jgi:hypothetical protein
MMLLLACREAQAQQATGRRGEPVERTADGGWFNYWTGKDSVGINYSVSPLKASGKLHIDLHTPDPGPFWIRISDASGKTVQQWKPEQLNYKLDMDLDIAQLPAGDYVCHICCGNDQNARSIAFQKSR